MSSANITVIAANYNNSQFLRKFVESIYSSTVLPSKIIITDDASTDNSVEVLNKLSESYSELQVIYFSENQGVAHARNAAIQQVETKYLLVADVDDLFVKNRIELQIQCLLDNPQVDLLGSNCSYFTNDSNQVIASSNFPLKHNEIVDSFKSAKEWFAEWHSRRKVKVISAALV